MIFRRLKAHIEKENWFAVGIDFAIVVIGVFIGIQVANWNETQTDRGVEAQYITRLLGELEAMLPEAEDAFRINEERENFITEIQTYFQTGEGLSALAPEHCAALARSHIYAGVIFYPPTIKELIATGRIVLIEDDTLRTAILSFDQTYGKISELRTDIQIDRLALHRNHPSLIQLGQSWTDTVCEFEAMRADTGFQNDFLDNRNRFSAYVYNVLEEQKNLIESLGRETAQSLKAEFAPDVSEESPAS